MFNNISLNGSFKFDIYDSGSNLLESITYNNFITNTGLQYLQTFIIADAFRYISLGTGNNFNSILHPNDTTGLYSGIPTYSYIGPNSNGYNTNGCGYAETCSGITLMKSWIVPTNGGFFPQNYNFQEFMLSPGSPDPSYNPSNIPPCTNEYSDFLNTYPNVCQCALAFTRVTGLVSVKAGNFMAISYSLNIGTNTGINYINLATVQDSPTETLWTNIQGYYSLIHHGLRLVNNGLAYNNYINNVDQPFRAGESVCDSINQPLGSPMEPFSGYPNNLQYPQIFLYLSSDNTQFLVSPVTGAQIDTGLYYPYNRRGLSLSSGNEYFQCNPTTSWQLNNFQVPFWLQNTRQTNTDNIFPCDNSEFPNNQYNYGCPDDQNISWIASIIGTNAVPSYTYTSNGRTGFKNIEVEFPATQVNEGMIGVPLKSMVLAWTGTSNNGNLYPFMDFVFFGTNGQSPQWGRQIDTGSLTYNFNDQNNYNYLDAQNNLSLTFQQTFSSPCNGALGC